jgi:hypothetical protein
MNTNVDDLLRSGAIVPISIETVSALLGEVLRLRAQVDIARTALLTIERKSEELRAKISAVETLRGTHGRQDQKY